jgi:hypothetical protein
METLWAVDIRRGNLLPKVLEIVAWQLRHQRGESGTEEEARRTNSPHVIRFDVMTSGAGL